MEVGGIWGNFYWLCLWIMRMAYLNILWGLFTLLGLIVIGFTPATVAMFRVIRKWLKKETEIPIFETFWSTYKEEFLKSNIFTIIIVTIGLILLVDLSFLGSITEHPIYPLLLSGLFLCGFIYLVLILYIFPLYVNYNLSRWLYIKYAILIGLTNLHYTITMMIVISGLYYLFMRIPGLIPFFSISTTGLVIMGISYLSFKNLDKKRSMENQQAKNSTT
ncbi:YesL family protein [Oceanobacillus kimchii]|uniref:YesL family protein n=1 Tax=Oceanobacillus kimchii TaxID=746691 RepID=UPI0021A3E077|nr:YesL family protein [Oceanobacillus kimchii]MCT1575736.1 YesL family protein [Oceanobacillus kimchii]MCT2135373.1 YesL family protein [Oceanobacillus kimchii]